MAIPLPRNRRTLDRHRVPVAMSGAVEFLWPRRRGQKFHARLRDVSYAGLSIILEDDIEGLEVGECLTGLSVKVDGIRFRGELLVMHITPGPQSGSACGGLFYPHADADVLALREAVRQLEGPR